MQCKNHPKRETNVSCASCGEGLCPECMVFTPVGVKCKECAAPTRGMVRKGKPIQYLGAAAAGFGASLFGGIILGLSIRGFFLMGLFLGYLVGLAVKKGAMGNRGPAFMAIAGASTLVGLIAAGVITRPMNILFIVIAAGIAAYQLSE